MKLYDITVPISNTTPVWPGDPPVKLERVKAIAQGDPCNVTRITMGAHTGTHIDAPRHFIEEGRTVDEIPMEALIGPCLVIETGLDRGLIEKGSIDRIDLKGHTRVLFKTGSSSFRREAPEHFREDFVALGLSAAEYLVKKGVLLVGVDYLSIESFHSDRDNPVHTTLLGNNVVILEGLDLFGIRPGPYELICLPLKLTGTDGAPARVLLREIE